jgi:hypothetical protein
VFIVVRLQCLCTAPELVTKSLVAGMAPMCHLDNLADPIGRSIGRTPAPPRLKGAGVMEQAASDPQTLYPCLPKSKVFEST